MLDPALSFERFVMGSTNALAATASRRAAESPGAVYNPLVVCGGSGVGKTHLLHAIGLYATALQPDIDVYLESAERIAERVPQRGGSVEDAASMKALGALDLLLVDEIEMLAGRSRAQAELAAIAERMIADGRQLVVSSIVSPSELPGFAPELLDVLNRGIVVEVGPPDVEMRRVMIDGFTRDRSAVLAGDAVRVLAEFDFANVQSLRSAVDSVLDVADRENRPARVEDVEAVLAGIVSGSHGTEAGSFLDDVKQTVAALVETSPWRQRVGEAVRRWEGEGIRTGRLVEALEADAPPDVDRLLEGFERDAKRLLEIRRELMALGIEGAPDDPAELARAEEQLAAALAGPADGSARNGASTPGAGESNAAAREDGWFLNPDKVVLDWLDLDGRLVVESH